MLNNLFISKVRVKMLNYFIQNLNEEIHVRGLVRELDEEINAVRRELQNLEESQLLISKKRGNKLFYRINPDNLYLTELITLFTKSREDIVLIHKALIKIENLDTALLTNSYVTDNHVNADDIDLLLIGEPDVQNLTKELKQIEEKLDKELRVTLLKKEDLEFHHKKRDDFLLNILRADKIILIGSEKDLI